MDRGAGQVTVSGITKSRTRLKQLNMYARTTPKINFCCEKIFIDSQACLWHIFLQHTAQNMCA